jgi:hypothetical protein
MRTTLVGRVLVGVIVVCLGLLLIGAYTEMPATQSTQASEVQGVTHHWIDRALGVMAYTEVAPAEKAAKAAAKKALSVPPMGIIRAAEHGYSDAQATLDLTKSLRGRTPVVVGHELLLYNQGRAARVYVNQDGAMKLLESGSLQEMLVTPSTKVTDQGDKDAREVALDAIAMSRGLGTAVKGAINTLVTAHVVGVVAEDGSHQIIRVGVDGEPSFEEW